MAYVSSAQYIANNHFVDGDLEACIYLQYENAVESIAYTRSVGGTVGAATSNTRKAGWKRTLNQSGTIESSLSHKSSYKQGYRFDQPVADHSQNIVIIYDGLPHPKSKPQCQQFHTFPHVDM